MNSHLVLGAGGFLGRHLVRALEGRGERVFALDVAFPAAPPAKSQMRDLFQLSERELATLVEECGIVHYLAWSSIPAIAERDPESDLFSNVGFMLRLLRVLRGTGKRLSFCSSGGTVYGRNSAPFIGEGAVLQPIGAYGAGKVAAELYANAARDTYGLDVRIARIANPFGAGQSRTRLQGAVSHFVYEALAHRPIEIWGDGSIVRDYVHVEDVVAGLIALADAPASAMHDVPAVNIGSGVGSSLNDIVAALEGALGRYVEVVHKPGRPFDVPRNVLDIGLARERLGWWPRLRLREGIMRMISDVEGNPECLFSTRLEEVTPVREASNS